MPSTAAPDRREHPRHFVRARARLADKRRGWDVRLLDMSHNGACLAIEASHHNLSEGDEVRLTVELDDVPLRDAIPATCTPGSETLHLRGTLVYATRERLAVEYYPLSAVDQALLTLLLSRPED
ncbi:PilZ domain-containing protein [Marinimicrobium sp. C2-29]|uniref:PilZ domain-containing protein n=1 Tax=Marinimicrobium sp. C2-29 TaxID=3139825 RepID=UPI003139CCD5